MPGAAGVVAEETQVQAKEGTFKLGVQEQDPHQRDD